MEEFMFRSIALIIFIIANGLMVVFRKQVSRALTKESRDLKYLAPFVLFTIVALVLVILNVETRISDMGLIIWSAMIGMSTCLFAIFFVRVVPLIRTDRRMRK